MIGVFVFIFEWSIPVFMELIPLGIKVVWGKFLRIDYERKVGLDLGFQVHEIYKVASQYTRNLNFTRFCQWSIQAMALDGLDCQHRFILVAHLVTYLHRLCLLDFVIDIQKVQSSNFKNVGCSVDLKILCLRVWVLVGKGVDTRELPITRLHIVTKAQSSKSHLVLEL